MPDPGWPAQLPVRDGLLLGVLGGIALYQLLAFSQTRHRNELWCSIHTGLAALLLASHFGDGCRDLWPRTPTLDQLAALTLPSLMAGSGVLLSISFLDLRQRRPQLLPYLYAYSALLLVLAVAPLAWERPAATADIAMALMVLSLVGQVILAADAGRSDRSAIIYCSAWLVSLGGLLLSDVDLHRIGQGDRLFHASVSLQSLLLALALASRMVRVSERRRICGLRAAAQVALLEQSRERVRGALHAIRLLAGLPMDEARSRPLQLIERTAQRLLRNLDSTGDDVALLRGPVRLAAVEFELSTMVRSILHGVAPLAAPAPMLYAVIDRRLPLRTTGDPQRLQRILTGLLERSLASAGKSDSVALRFCMGCDTAGQRASMIVSLCAPHAAKLRDVRFQRLVRILGGDSGTRGARELWLRLPLQGHFRDIPPPPRPYLLVLHPNRIYRRTLASVLRADGYRVDEVGTGRQVLERIGASQCGDQRYDWLIAQPGPGDWTAVRILGEVRRRWPHSAIRLLELLERGQRPRGSAVERPLLCNDIGTLLRPLRSRVLPSYPSLLRPPKVDLLPGPLRGMRLLIAAMDQDLRCALACILEDQGGSVDQSETGRGLEHRYRRICRDDALPFDALILCGAAALTADMRSLRRFEQRRGCITVPVLVVVDSEADGGVEDALRRAGARVVLKQPVTMEALVKALVPLKAPPVQDG